MQSGIRQAVHRIERGELVALRVRARSAVARIATNLPHRIAYQPCSRSGNAIRGKSAFRDRSNRRARSSRSCGSLPEDGRHPGSSARHRLVSKQTHRVRGRAISTQAGCIYLCRTAGGVADRQYSKAIATGLSSRRSRYRAKTGFPRPDSARPKKLVIPTLFRARSRSIRVRTNSGSESRHRTPSASVSCARSVVSSSAGQASPGMASSSCVDRL